MQNGHYVICFDVCNDKRRRRLVRWLENFSYRIQYSVFAMEGDEKKLAKIQQGIELATTEDDSVFIFPMNIEDWNNKIQYGKECDGLKDCDKRVVIL